jgi:hypothetical protein
MDIYSTASILAVAVVTVGFKLRFAKNGQKNDIFVISLPKLRIIRQASETEKELCANLSLCYLGVLQTQFLALKMLLLSTNNLSRAVKIL